MTRLLPLLLFILISTASSTSSSSYEQKMAGAYLDAAAYMIRKANNFPTGCEKNVTRKSMDCSELLEAGYNRSGVYTIWPASRVTQGKSLKVYCDMETDGGGWTLIQRRGNFGREENYFYKDWKSYKEGFGDIEKDFWLGNDNIFTLTNQNLYSARFDLKDVEKNTRYAQYDNFWIDDEDHKYTLHIYDYTGNAGDSMKIHHNNQTFTTKDEDNDKQKDKNCALLYKGGWWYGGCHHANLNGLYLNGKHESYGDGIVWQTWKGFHESLESTEIKIRPKKFKLSHVSLNNTPNVSSNITPNVSSNITPNVSSNITPNVSSNATPNVSLTNTPE